MITIIAAVAANRVIGKKNDLPWYLPEDLARFKTLTKGHPVIMGRNTYESILARLKKPLPDRVHFVLTRQSPEQYPVPEEFKDQVFLVKSFDEAVEAATKLDDNVFVVGGEKVFAEALPKADQMELTQLKAEYEGDAYFPEFNPNEWRKWEQNHGTYSFITYKRF